ncbi:MULTISPECIES: Fic family protein [Cysteiniphilum]|uniref:Cell division protein Fic n=1 Tax=Cysteiniphilum litorale TaxID=2056700 RepID=A0A8J3EAI7_9GAMM|nr:MULTISPECIES: Fic family protein [Cysteiniphilum]GGG06507.1 cell division protein Fic [Cysteiniphilum litorale]
MPFLPRFSINNKIAQYLTTIERARGFLEASQLSDHWIQQMQNKALILEAHHTTHIEGTQLTLDQSEKILAGFNVPDTNKDDVQELLNYRKAFELVSQSIDDNSHISEAIVREIHKRLVSDVRGDSAAPGEYRKIQNYVVNSKTGEAIYTPPPAYDVPIMMSELIYWLNNESEINPILIAGIAQFQFVHIHPFLDGNGRTGRLLSTLCLYRHGYDFKKLFSISEYYDRNRIEYYQALQSVRENALDMTQWLEYFTHGLSTQMQEIRHRGEDIIKLDVLKLNHELNDRQTKAVEHIIEHGQINMQEFSLLCPDVNKRTLQRELKAMAEKKLIESQGATNKLIYVLKN